MSSHKINHKKFGRRSKPRKALFRAIMLSIIEHDSITTTLAKAKAVRPILERFLTRIRKAPALLDTYRIARSELGLIASQEHAQKVVTKLQKLGEYFKDRPGGYLQIFKDGLRLGDNAPMAVIQFVTNKA